MTTATATATAATIATIDTTASKSTFMTNLKKNLACWTMTRADMAKMQKELASEYKQQL